MKRGLIWITMACIAICASSCAESESEPKSGKAEKCDASFQPTCAADNMVLQCLNGEYTPVMCPAGKMCSGGNCVSVSCVQGTRCNGNNLVTCQNGVESTIPCPNGCDTDHCRTAPVTCTNGTNRCVGANLVTCQNGVETTIPCPNGCDTDHCRTVPVTCTNGTSRCVGANLVTCQNGVENTIPCPNGCDTDHCKPNAGLCIEGSVRCDDNELVTCENGVENRKLCLNGCHNNACVAECGNNVREGDEKCDGSDLGEYTCKDLPDAMQTAVYTGIPECNATCDGIENGSCEKDLCGNNILDLDAGEFCDVVDGESKFKDEPTCYSLKGYEGKIWQEGGRPGCSDDCKSYKKGTCKLAAQPQGGIETCQFISLTNDKSAKEVSGYALVTPIAGATQELISGQLACGNLAAATYSWQKEAARFVECEDCKAGEYKLVSEQSYASYAGGTYGCVFQIYVNTITIDGNKSTSYYNCPVEYGYPVAQDLADESVVRTFDVEQEQVEGTVLAHWDFSNFVKDDKVASVQADDGVFKSTSVLSVSDGSTIRMLTGTGKYPESAASCDQWSQESTLDLNAKHFVLKLSSTGYKNVRFQFMAAGSGISTKHIVAVYRFNNLVAVVGDELSFDDKNQFVPFPLTPLESASNQSEFELDVYTYAASEANMTIRLDDIFVIGDPM